MTTKKSVLIAPSSFGVVDQAPLEKLKQEALHIIPNPYGRKLSKQELLALLADVTSIIAGLEPLSRDVLEQSRLKVISRCGAGLSNIDLEAAKELGIKVRYTPDAPTQAVAELTVGAMITLMRMLPQMDRDLHQGRWTKRTGYQLSGKTVGIVGFGRIGRKLARLLKPFDVRILAVDPGLNGSAKGAQVVSLETALSQSDVISLHASAREELIAQRELDLMKPGSFLLNPARGELVNELDLCDALERGTLAAAWIDTFSREPYSGPLTRYPQVILTPHIGSYAVECRKSMEMEAVENLLLALSEDGNS